MPDILLPQQPPKRPQVQLREHLMDPETYATILLLIAVDRYGTEALEWAPDTLRLQLGEDFGAAVPEVNIDKLVAASTLLTTNYFFKSLPRFIQICNVLSGTPANPEVFDPADSIECAWGITEGMLICPPDEDEPFCDDIRHYITAVLANEGYVTPPDVLRIGIGADLSGQLNTDYADDPAVFAGLYQNQEEKSDEVNSLLKENLQELFETIAKLPLEHGQTAELLQRLPKDLTPTPA